MNWSSWEAFFSMGGYAVYVWGSYGVTLAVMAAEVAWLRRRQRAALEDVRRLRGADVGGVR